jgi:hypothetical protein
MRAGWLKSFLLVLPFFLVGFLPGWASSPASSPEGLQAGGEGIPSGSSPGQPEPAGFQPVGASSPEGGTTAPSGETAVSLPQVLPAGKPERLTAEEKEILSRVELLENLELLENIELFEDFLLVLKEDEEE